MLVLNVPAGNAVYDVHMAFLRSILETQEECEEVKKGIAKKRYTFEEAARDKSKCIVSGGKDGWIGPATAGEWDRDMSDAIWKTIFVGPNRPDRHVWRTEVGELTECVKNRFGERWKTPRASRYSDVFSPCLTVCHPPLQAGLCSG